ncbi:MAG: hypothetical protein WKG32_04915 [Gemmatimonadaceae bacterium]
MKLGKIEAVELAAVSDIAQVLPGFSTGKTFAHDPAGTHQVVLSRHLTPGLPYLYRPEDEFRIDPGRAARRYELRPGDVLFMSRGTRNVASWIERVPEPAVAPVSFYILRPTERVSPAYLTWYLNQPTAQRELAQIRTGATTPIVQRAAFAELCVSVPDAAAQQRIGELGEMMARERLLLDRLADAVGRAHAASSDQLARSLLAHAHHGDGEPDNG